MKTTNRNIPKLRFPEFEGEWEMGTLKNIFDISAGGDVPKENVSSEKTDYFKYPIYANAEKNKGFYGYSNLYKVEPDVITVAGRGVNIGIAHVRNHRFYPIVRLLVLKPKHKVDLHFFEYELNRISLFKESTGVPQLTAPQMAGYSIFSPTPPEQQKIAEFLTAVDKRIRLLEEKKQHLETYKRGVMQKLFSQEIRFKDDDGNDFADWEEKKLGEVGEIVTGKTPDTSDMNLWGGNIKFITPSDIDETVKWQKETSRTVTKHNKLRVLPPNTIIYTCIASIGKMCISVEPSITNQQINSVIVSKDNFEFIYYNLLHITPRIKSTQANTTLPIINKTDFSKFSLNIPSLPEQQKIANFLSSLDEKIGQLGVQIAQSQDFKKGLLQQMFV